MKLVRLLACLAFSLTLLAGANAMASDFTITKDVGAGTFTFIDTNPSAPVFEIVVDGLGLSAGTTRPGFSASTILFGADPQNCLPVLGSTITSGFCYKLTDPVAGKPITSGSTVLTYNSSFDTTAPSDFAIAFNLPNGSIGACFGNTGPTGGCSSSRSVPEPGSSMAILTGFLLLGGIFTVVRRRALATLPAI